MSFTKIEVASYTPAWNKGVTGAESHAYGKTISLEHRKTLSAIKKGGGNPSWNGGSTNWRRKVANHWSSKLNRERIEGNCCSSCGSTESLEADHIEPVGENPEKAFDVSNMQLLCESCHRRKTNTERQTARHTVTWYPVTSIENAGTQVTYDIEVEHESHNYVANRLVVHNSQRYCSESFFDYTEPELNEDQRELYIEAMISASDAYRDLIRAGMKKEDARMVLPNATTTELIVTGNLQAFKDFIALRTVPAAQYEIRQVALGIERVLQAECPNVFGELNDE